MTLDGAKVPLTDTNKSDVHGQLTIHTAQVGPGPLAQEFLAFAQQVKTILDNRPASSGQNAASNWLMIPEQTVRVDVADGRVLHQGLTMTAGDVLIRTSGSVGLDETLAIMAEVPIRDEWVTNKKYLSSLRGTVIQIPLQGTLSKPRIDNRMLQELSGRMIGGAARGILQDEVNRGLQRLFGPNLQGEPAAPQNERLKHRSRNNCPMSPWRKLPACGRKWHRKLEAYATCFSNGAKAAVGRNQSKCPFSEKKPGFSKKPGFWDPNGNARVGNRHPPTLHKIAVTHRPPTGRATAGCADSRSCPPGGSASSGSGSPR